MSVRHPVIAVTGSSGAGTTTVMKAFAHIFRRENIQAQVIEGDSFHRYDRVRMRERVRAADTGKGPAISHLGPESNLLADLANTMAAYGATGGGKVRRYIHDASEAKELAGEPGTFTDWKPMGAKSDLLFYEGLHGGYQDGEVDVAKNVDLLVGVVRIVNLEWIQKLHRDQNMRGYSQDAVVETILRRMPDYVKDTVRSSAARTSISSASRPWIPNPFIARDIPTADESLVVIRFANPKGIDFPYLLSMLRDFVDEPAEHHCCARRKDGLGDAVHPAPMILRLMDLKRRAQ